MNPIGFLRRRPLKTLMLVVVALLSGGGVLLSKIQPDIYPLNTPRIRAYMAYIDTHTNQMKRHIVDQYESYFHTPEEKPASESQTIVVSSPMAKDVTITRQYVCQMHSRRHIDVRALEDGYLEEIKVKEGQAVKQGDVMFTLVPTLYQAKLDAELAERDLAQLELNNTRRLADKKGVSENEVKLFEAKLARAQAKANQEAAELYFTIVRAPFDGIMDSLREQKGSLVQKGDILTTLSDNSVMWVYFNVPEARYLEYKGLQSKRDQEHPGKLKLADARIELVLADGSTFNQTAGDVLTVEGSFDNQTGNISFRADFPNPDGLLRHGQTGDVLIHRTLHNALVIPLRATFEVLDKRYVYVVGEDHVVHQRLITIQHELEDVIVIKKGLDADDRIVLEGVRQVQDGRKVEYEFRAPEVALTNQKNHAE